MSLSEEVLYRLNIVDVVWKYIDLKKTWRNYIALCPFHQEKTPSFVVSEDKQIFKCFWCWIWWNAIKFVQEIEKIEYFDALKMLAEEVWIKIDTNKTKNDKTLQLTQKLLQINKTALNFFHWKPLEYLKKRQISTEYIKKYKLWYAPNSFYELIDYLKNKWFSDEIILKAGLGRKSTTWDLSSFFVNRIVFPIFSVLWDVVAFSGRIFNGEEKVWKYINTPETVVYNKSKILYNYHISKQQRDDYVIVVEWYMDVIWLDRLWYKSAVATCGTALTNIHIKLLKRLSDKIILSFDNDKAWFDATVRWIKLCLEEKVFPYIFVVEDWKDFDEIANQNKKIDILSNMQEAVSYIIDHYLSDYNKLSPVERQKALNKISDVIKHIKDYTTKWTYIEIISWKIWINPHMLEQQLKSSTKERNKTIQQTNIGFTNNELIWALFFEQFYKQYWTDENMEKVINVLIEILDYLQEENIIKKSLLNTLLLEEKDKLKQAQLWWEKNLENSHTENIQYQIWDAIKRWLMETIKANKSIPREKAAQIIKNLR